MANLDQTAGAILPASNWQADVLICLGSEY